MTVSSSEPKIGLASRMVNAVLAIKPLADFAKSRARKMMIDRAETIGVPWRENVNKLAALSWSQELAAVQDDSLVYPEYYTTSFHAYEAGNLSWQAAWEVESAALAVHAKIWSAGDNGGDAQLRQSYHQILQQQIAMPTAGHAPTTPQTILDLGCGVGMSTRALQAIYPQAKITGVDLSPYFLAVAQHQSQYKSAQSSSSQQVDWVHAPAESTGLPSNSFDLVSASLMFHELPTSAAVAIITEASRLLRPGGHLAIMDMNPRSPVFEQMPPYILTLLKSTEPYLDQYFALDLEQIFLAAGMASPTITVNSPRHRTIIAQAI